MKTLMTSFVLQLLLLSTAAIAQENCYNGLDDDNDGLIDLNDPDCNCSGINTTTETYISNPSFEQLSSCPTNYSQLSNATGWEQASYGTSDYLNTCGFVFPQFQQSSVLPFPDGAGATGGFVLSNYKEFVGSVLNTPLQAGTTYNLELTAGLFGMIYNGDTLASIQQLGPIEFTLYGAASSFNFPFAGYSAPPSNAYHILGTATLIPNSTYQELLFTFTPTVNVEVLVMGPPENLPAAYPGLGAVCYPYYVLDKLEMYESQPVQAPTITATGSSCNHSLTLTASNTVSGAAGQWYYNGVALIGQTNNSLSASSLGLGAGMYQFVNYNAQGCVRAELEVAPSTFPSVNDETITACAGSIIDLAGTANSQNFWYGSNNDLLSSAVNFHYSVTSSTSVMHVVSLNGCADTAMVAVTVPNVVFDVIEKKACRNSELEISTPLNEIATWSPSNGLNTVSGNVVTALVTQEITYTAQFTVSGCAASQLVHIVPIAVQFDADLGIDNNQFIMEAYPATNEYSWSLPNNTTIGGNYVVTDLPAENGMITVVLMVNSPQGCTDSAHYHYNFQQPVIDSSAMVFVPNVFTPNGDGINGVFKPVFTAEINAYQLTIFNRWGEQVFQSNEVTEGWDGTFKGQECTDGTYTWVLQYGDTTNAFKQQLNGSVSLFR